MQRKSMTRWLVVIVLALLNSVQVFAFEPLEDVFVFDPFAKPLKAGLDLGGALFMNDAGTWGPEEATGPPNTPRAGDFRTAWASRTQDEQEEWLQLTYEKAVVPTQVVIHETFNPGAVTAVAVIVDGDEKLVWEGKHPTPVGAGKGVSKIPLKTKLRTNQIRIYLDSFNVPGWNEIDAVGLVGKAAPIQWASDATASSSYADLVAGLAVNRMPAFNNNQEATTLIQQREKQMAALMKRLREQEEQLKAANAEITRLTAELNGLRKRQK